MISDYQDWAIEYEHQPGKQSILSTELIQFYVKGYVEELIEFGKISSSPHGSPLSFQLNWDVFVAFTKQLSGGAAVFEHVNLQTVQGLKLKMHVERIYQDQSINSMLSKYKTKFKKEQQDKKKEV